MIGRTCLYRLYAADGALLYVGISRSALRRLGQHLAEKPWAEEVARTTVEWFDTREAAAAAEVAAIVTERPRHNIAHNRAQQAQQQHQRWSVESVLRPVVPDNDRLTTAEIAEITRILATRGHYGPVLTCHHERVMKKFEQENRGERARAAARKCRDCGDWIGHPIGRPTGGRA